MAHSGMRNRSWLVLALCALLLAGALAGCGSNVLSTTREAADGATGASAESGQAAQAAQADQATLMQDPHAVVVHVCVDASNAHAYNAKYPESLADLDLYILPGQSVYDALVATGLDVAVRGEGYVESIGGLAEKQCGRNSGWLYSVDDVFGSRLARDVKLQGGEDVHWAYTVEQGDVQGAEHMTADAGKD